jgi:hypothetical protein
VNTVQPPPMSALCRHHKRPEHCFECDPEYAKPSWVRQRREPGYPVKVSGKDVCLRAMAEKAVDEAFERFKP